MSFFNEGGTALVLARSLILPSSPLPENFREIDGGLLFEQLPAHAAVVVIGTDLGASTVIHPRTHDIESPGGRALWDEFVNVVALRLDFPALGTGVCIGGLLDQIAINIAGSAGGKPHAGGVLWNQLVDAATLALYFPTLVARITITPDMDDGS